MGEKRLKLLFSNKLLGGFRTHQKGVPFHGAHKMVKFDQISF